MFYKAGSCTGTVAGRVDAASAANTKKGKGNSKRNDGSSSKMGSAQAMDVPLRKSDRRHLLQQVLNYFEPQDRPAVHSAAQVSRQPRRGSPEECHHLRQKTFVRLSVSKIPDWTANHLHHPDC